MSKGKNTYNVLVTGAGGPAGINALRLLSKIKGVKTFAVDQNALSAGKFFASDFRKVPGVLEDRKGLGIALKKRVAAWNIDLLLPTVAEELVYIEELLSGSNIFVEISPKKTLKVCADKMELYDFVHGRLPHYVPAYSFESKDHLPDSDIYFLKPRVGRGSKGTRPINKAELEALSNANCLPNTIIMEYLPGLEWTVDAYYDTDGKEVFMTPRERLGFAGGISAKGRTVKNESVLKVAHDILSLFSFKGPVFIQLKEAADGSIKLVEINPRLSGGVTITAAAGANPMQVMISLYRDKLVPKVRWRETTVIRYLEDIIVS